MARRHESEGLVYRCYFSEGVSENRVTGKMTKGERAYCNSCYGKAIAGAPEAATMFSTAELTSSKMCVSANRARQAPYGKLDAVGEGRCRGVGYAAGTG